MPLPEVPELVSGAALTPLLGLAGGVSGAALRPASDVLGGETG